MTKKQAIKKAEEYRPKCTDNLVFDVLFMPTTSFIVDHWRKRKAGRR